MDHARAILRLLDLWLEKRVSAHVNEACAYEQAALTAKKKEALSKQHFGHFCRARAGESDELHKIVKELLREQ